MSDTDIYSDPEEAPTTPSKRRRFDTETSDSEAIHSIPRDSMSTHASLWHRAQSQTSSQGNSQGNSSDSVSTTATTRSSISQLSALLADNPDEYQSYTVYTPPTVEGIETHGGNFKTFNPFFKIGLYSKMARNCTAIDEVVDAFLQQIQRDFNCIHDLLQIIPDLLLVDYQVEEYSSQDYLIEIGPLFQAEARKNKNIRERDTIFNHNSEYARNLSNMIEVFLWYLCKKLTNDTKLIPIAERIFRVFLSFLRQVSCSKLAALRLTALTFAFRISKFLSIRKLQLALQEGQDVDRASMLFSKIEDILKTNNIDSIYTNSKEAICKLLYIEVARDIKICMIANEQLFINDKNLEFLGGLLMLKNRAIVLHALATCKIFTTNPSIRFALDMDSFKKVLDGIYQNLYSQYDGAVILAASFFANAFKSGYELVNTSAIVSGLMVRAFSLNLKIGQACGEAIAYYLAQFDSVQVYRNIIVSADGFNTDTGGKAALPYLVESLYPHLKELLVQQIVTTLTIDTKLTTDEYKKVAEILFYVCCIRLNGKTAFQRTRNKVPDASEFYQTRDNSDVAQLLVLSFREIIQQSKCDNEPMVWIFKALSLICYSFPEMFQLKSYVDYVVETGVAYFDEVDIHLDMLWQHIVRFVQAASKMNGGYLFAIKLESKLEKAVVKYKQFLQDYNLNIGDSEELMLERKLRVECELSKIQRILERGITADFIQLDLFYQYWVKTNLPNEIVERQIMCCAFYFKNLSKDLTDALQSGNIATMPINENYLTRLRNEAFSFWKSLDALFPSNRDLQSSVFEAMAIFTNYKLLFSAENLNVYPQLKSADVFPWKSWDSMDAVIEFFYEVCIHTSTRGKLPMSVRRKYVKMFFTLFQCALLPDFPVHSLVTIIVFDMQCSRIYPNSPKYLQVLWDVSPDDYYRLILKILSLKIADGTSEDSEYYKEINFDEITKFFIKTSPEEHRLPFVRFAIKDAMEMRNYDILNVIRPFVDALKAIDKSDLNTSCNDFSTVFEDVPGWVTEFFSTI